MKEGEKDNHLSLQLAAAEKFENYGDARLSKNEYWPAYTHYKKAFDIRRSVLGRSHYDTVKAAFNTGKCLHCLRKTSHALRYYKIFCSAVYKALFLSSKRKGSKSSPLLSKETIFMLHSIAWVFRQEKSFDRAFKFYWLAIETGKRVLGGKSKIVARILNQLGNSVLQSGDLSVALKYHEECLTIERAIQQEQTDSVNEDVLDMMTSISNVAGTLEKLGHIEKSLASYDETLSVSFYDYDVTSETSRILVSKIRRKHADALMNVARLQGKLGRPAQVLKALAEALMIRKLEYGCTHKIVATTLNEMGIAYGEHGNTRLALYYFEESLRIRAHMDSPDDHLCTPVSTVLYNIACIHEHAGNSCQALECLRKATAHEFSRREGGNKPASTEVLLDSLELTAQIYQTMSDFSAALVCLESGIRVIVDEGLDVLSPQICSRYLGKAGSNCLKLDNIKKAVHFFIWTMRVNTAGGLAFDANIKEAKGHFLDMFENDCAPAAAAA